MDHLPHLRETIDIVEASTRPAKLETTPLPYGEKDLEPVMSRATIDYHYEHLAKGYAKRYNAGEGNLDFNRAGSFLHNKFFPQLREPKGLNKPRGAVSALIETNRLVGACLGIRLSKRQRKVSRQYLENY